jgi:hypothetical protein
MRANLPEDLNSTIQQLIEKWILSQPTVETRADGFFALASAFLGELEVFLGEVATRAIFARANALMRQRYTYLGNLVATEGAPDVAVVRDTLRGMSADSAGRILADFVDLLNLVLFSLLGAALVPLLREVVADLGAREGTTLSDEEEL